jgi:hypothetical protein
MDRRNPAFNAWIIEVALDVAFRESKGQSAQMANTAHLFHDREGRYWSVLAELRSQPWLPVQYDFIVDWCAPVQIKKDLRVFPFTKGDSLLRDLRQPLSQSQKCEDDEEDGNG